MQEFMNYEASMGKNKLYLTQQHQSFKEIELKMEFRSFCTSFTLPSWASLD